MPRKPRTITPNDEPLARLPAVAPTVPVAPVSATVERREQDLEDLLSELGSDGRIKIWHVIDGKSSYAGEMSLDGFSLDALVDAFGGGDKTLVFYQGREKRETIRMSLDPSIPVRNPKAPKAVPVAPSGTPLADMTTLMAAMAQGQMSSMQMMQTMTAQQASMMTTMMQAVAAVLAAKKDDRDPMDAALKMAELLKTNQSTPASELFTIFEKGMNVAKNMGGSDDDGTLALAKEGLSLVGKIVENQAPQGRVARAVPVVPPALAERTGPVPNGRSVANANGVPAAASEGPQPTAHSAGGAGTPVVDDGPARPWVKAVGPAAPLLLLSIGNVQPETAASIIADRLSPDEFEDLLTDIEHDTANAFVDRFVRYFSLQPLTPDVRDWMLRCVEAVQGLVESEGDIGEPILPTGPGPATSEA